MEKQTIKPIETFYNGYRFRSRLEARWAVFFDACGIPYMYEPEGFKLKSGKGYLPDFYLPNVGWRAHGGLWVEVKGVMTKEDKEKIEQFCDYDKYGNPRRSILVVGDIPNPIDSDPLCVNDRYTFSDDIYWNCATIDGDDYPVEFHRSKNGEIGICGFDNTDYYEGFDWFHDKYLIAKQARFEHGECG